MNSDKKDPLAQQAEEQLNVFIKAHQLKLAKPARKAMLVVFKEWVEQDQREQGFLSAATTQLFARLQAFEKIAAVGRAHQEDPLIALSEGVVDALRLGLSYITHYHASHTQRRTTRDLSVDNTAWAIRDAYHKEISAVLFEGMGLYVKQADMMISRSKLREMESTLAKQKEMLRGLSSGALLNELQLTMKQTGSALDEQEKIFLALKEQSQLSALKIEHRHIRHAAFCRELRETFGGMQAELDAVIAPLDKPNFALHLLKDSTAERIGQAYNAGAAVEAGPLSIPMPFAEGLPTDFLSICGQVENHIKQGGMDSDDQSLVHAGSILETEWLLDNLCRSWPNADAFYQGAHTKDNALEFLEGRDVLGYLAQQAENLLANHGPLDALRSTLPFVRPWYHGVQAAIAARTQALLVNGAYWGETESTLPRLEAVAKGCMAFIDSLARERTPLFMALGQKYLDAANEMRALVLPKLTAEIAALTQAYPLTYCFNAGLLDASSVGCVRNAQPKPQEAPTLLRLLMGHLAKIPADKATADKLGSVKVPAILLLADRLGAGRLHLQLEITRNAGTLTSKMTLYFMDETDTQELFTINSTGSGAATAPDVELFEKATMAAAGIVIAAVNAPLINKITQRLALVMSQARCDGTFNTKLAPTPLLDPLIQAPVAALAPPAGPSAPQVAAPVPPEVPGLLPLCDSLCEKVLHDLRDTRPFMDCFTQLRQIAALSSAYQMLIGLPFGGMQHAMPNVPSILEKDNLIVGLAARMQEAIDGLQCPDLSLCSPVRNKMEGVTYLLSRYTAMAQLHAGFNTQLDLWKKSLHDLQTMQAVLLQMEAITRCTGNLFLPKDMALFMQSKTNLLEIVMESRKLLVKTRQQLTLLSFKNLQDIPEVQMPKKADFGVDDEVVLRRGVACTKDQLKGKDLIDIIRNSANPHADVLTFFSGLDMKTASARARRQNRMGETALQAATVIGDVVVIKSLIHYGALVDKKILQINPKHNVNQVRTLLKSHSEWQRDEIDPQIPGMIEEAAGKIEGYAGHQKNAIMVFGSTHVGKSTLISFMNGTEYSVTRGNIHSYMTYLKGKEECARSANQESRISTTQHPSMHCVGDNVYVDMQGFEGTQGPKEDMRTGVSTQFVAAKCDSVKAILLVTNHAELTDSGKGKLRKTCNKIGRILAKNLSAFSHDPDALESYLKDLSKNLLLVVTNPGAEVDNIKKYEDWVREELTNWLSSDDLLDVMPGDEKYPEKLVLECLLTNIDNVMLVEANKPAARDRLNKKLNSEDMKARPTSDFNFSNYHEDAELLKRFLTKMQAYRSTLHGKSAHCTTALCSAWKTKIEARHAPESVGLDSSHYQQEPLLNNLWEMAKRLEQLDGSKQALVLPLISLLNRYAEADSGVTGNPEAVTRDMIDLMRQADMNADFFHELDNLSALIEGKAAKSVAMGAAADAAPVAASTAGALSRLGVFTTPATTQETRVDRGLAP